MNADMIAAKANAWEVDQHVGRAVDAKQPEREREAQGVGEGHGTISRFIHLRYGLKSLFFAA